ncbi:MAG: ATP-binding protein [Porcipelethomonas sp.]
MKSSVWSFRMKLCMYFVIFAAIIFSVLWILQTVFLQDFYNNMLINNTRNVAQTIIDSGGDTEIIDDLALNNFLLIYLTDENGNIYYSADEYKSTYHQIYNDSYQNDNENPYHQSEEMNWQKANYRNLPDGYEDFLSALKESENGITEYKTDTLYVYGTYISGNILYVSTALDPVGETAKIIKALLLLVTIASLIVAFVLACLISKKFSEPIAEISRQAERLGTDDYSGELHKGFCSELDKLGDTLNNTNEKLHEANNFQRELLANVSHDLRTPLTMIKGYAESIKDFGNDEKQRIDDTEIIIRESDRLTDLVNEILEYSELQANGRNADFSAVDFSLLVNGVISQFEPLFRSSGGIIEKNIAGNMSVNGCERQLERVIYNLIDNAVRHTGDSKKISVTLKQADDRVRLEVTDFGKGIPSEQLIHIWDRYYTFRQRNKQGVSGLGLPIVKQIVHIHSGTCGVVSTENVGSTFWVELNITKKERLA